MCRQESENFISPIKGNSLQQQPDQTHRENKETSMSCTSLQMYYTQKQPGLIKKDQTNQWQRKLLT